MRVLQLVRSSRVLPVLLAAACHLTGHTQSLAAVLLLLA